ncbi:hypothetical protein [Tautonia sociabilis]|uniref:Uncharacterized protein n=1 Tax=Tautonia sociabilis TaxID=2080755 RepID=A0A432MRK7_9BACT|nr:hypothetical protein [Tautonia sociabilis]RUL89606.1 hypothetical protein TsocGM_00075 [Tautonia sociabilis]
MTPHRILLNPEAGEGGATAGAATAREAGPGPEAPDPGSASDPSPADASRAAEERLRTLERRFDEERSRLARKAEDWERACKTALKEKELAAALAGRPLVRGAAAQLIALWRDELEVVDEADRLRVRSRDGRSVEDAVASWLAGPDYSHFVRPASRGGTAPPGDSRSASSAPAASPPRTLGETVLQQWREAVQASRRELGVPIGLGRRRV